MTDEKIKEGKTLTPQTDTLMKFVGRLGTANGEEYFAVREAMQCGIEALEIERDDFKAALDTMTQLFAEKDKVYCAAARGRDEALRALSEETKRAEEIRKDAELRLCFRADHIDMLKTALRNACESEAVHGQQPPRLWLDALQGPPSLLPEAPK